jgi:hypothetical protein
VNSSVEKTASVVGNDTKPRPFGTVLRDLLIERGMTTGIGNPDWVTFARALPDVSYESLRKAVTGERPPGIKIMESAAAALDVDPDVFWEHQLAHAQRSFNPAEVGEAAAFANLQAWLQLSSGTSEAAQSERRRRA